MIEKIINRILEEDKPKENNKIDVRKRSKNDYKSLIIPKQNFFVYNTFTKQTNFLKIKEDVNFDLQAMMLENSQLKFEKVEKTERKEKKTNSIKMKLLKSSKIEKVDYFDNLKKSNDEKYKYFIKIL
jgi:hypothetical protein